jgi:large subunit ribosomal protein L4
MAVATYTNTGAKATTAAKLDKTVFGVTPQNHDLLKQAYTAYLANGRTNNAVTKTRGLVSGGGKKPWKQKGTGRARFGSTRNPIWRGGGIAFGPTGEENYTKDINVKAKRLAIRQALSLAADDNKVIVLEDVVSKDGKTSELATLLAKVGANRRTLLVVENKTPELIRATNNLGDVKLVQATYLNVYDVMNADSIVVTNASLGAISTWLGGTAKVVVDGGMNK